MRRSVILVVVIASIAVLTGLGLAIAGLVAGAGGARPMIIEDGDFGTVEVYAVDDTGSLVPAPDPGSLTAQVWATFERVATPEFTAEVMVEYQVGDAPESDTLAYVHQSDDPELWVLAANLATSEDPILLIPTLIHEYAHILTLSPGQLTPGAASCPTIDLDEGCADAGSAMWRFQEEFWSGYEDAPDAANGDWEVTDAFYAAHPDDFVSDYAATNVVEDVAESFMTFVLEDRPTGDSVVAQKLEFFWQVPEYVESRERIRAEFADELGLVP